jgi:hypothetical protein
MTTDELHRISTQLTLAEMHYRDVITKCENKLCLIEEAKQIVDERIKFHKAMKDFKKYYRKAAHG